MRNESPLFRGRQHKRTLVRSAETSSLTNNSSTDPLPSPAVGAGATVTREDNQSIVHSSLSVIPQSRRSPVDSSTSVTHHALERRDTGTELSTASSSALGASEAPASLASEHTESHDSTMSSTNDLQASAISAENSLDSMTAVREESGAMESPSLGPSTPSSSPVSSFEASTESDGGSGSSTSFETSSAVDLISDPSSETRQSTSSASNAAPEPNNSSTVDSPTQDSTTHDIAPTSTEPPSTWSELAPTTSPPSSTPSAQRYAASQQASPTSSVTWDEHSTYQESQLTESYQQSSDSYHFVAAVYVESSTSTETVWETSTVPLSTSQAIVNGQGHTSWVQSTSYSTVKRPVTTMTAIGKVTTTGAANVAGASTATAVTKPDPPEDTVSPGSDAALSSSEGSMSKGDIAGIAIGCLTAVAGIILLLFFFCKRRRQRSGAVKLHDEYHPEMSSRSTLKRNGTQHSAMDFSDGPLYASRQPTLLDPVPELPESQRISKDGMWEYASDDGQRSPVRNAEARFTHYDDWLAYEYANSPFSEKNALPESTKARASIDGDSISTTIRSPSNATNSIYGLPFDAHGNPSRFTPKLQTGPSIQSLHSVSTVEERHFGFSAEIGSIDEASSVGHGSTSHATSVSYGSARGLIHHHHHVQSMSGTYGVAR